MITMSYSHISKLHLFLASYMEKVRHLFCICYGSVIRLASVALKDVQTVKKRKVE